MNYLVVRGFQMKKVPVVLLFLVSFICFQETTKAQNMDDIREQATSVQITLKYMDYNWCVKEKRMVLESEELAEAKILDSLKALPKGGFLFVQLPTSLLIKNDPRNFRITVRDHKGKQLVNTDLNESRAQEADEAGLSNLGILPLPAFSRGDLAIVIEEDGARQVFEYTIDMSSQD